MSAPGPDRLPGTRLLAFARAIFDDAIVSDVIEPTIADLQQEWIAARESRAGRWLARWRGYVAFWALVCLAPVSLRHWRGRAEQTKTSRRRLMAVFGVIAVAIIWGANGFHYFVWTLSRSIELLPGSPWSAIGAWAGAAFLAGPIVILLMKRFAGRVPWSGIPLGAAVLLVCLSVTLAAALAASASLGAFSGIGARGSAGIVQVLPPVVLAARSMQIAMLALVVMLLVLSALALRGGRDSAQAAGPQKPQMSAMQSIGLSGLIIVGMLGVDRLLGQYQSVMEVVILLVSPPTPDGPSGRELASRSEGILILFGAGVILTFCLLTFGIGLWRASRRYAPTTLFTWTSRAALVVALAGSIWHTTAAFTVVRDVDRLVQRVFGSQGQTGTIDRSRADAAALRGRE